MTITGLEQMTKTKFKVFADEEFAFVLTKSELALLELSEGSEISDDLYRHITDELLLKKAKLKALNLLKARDYTEAALRDKLKADFYPPFLIDRAVDYVKSYNYINDERFIDNFCRLNKDTMSRQMLVFKLRQKGAPPQLIDDYMSEFETDSTPQLLRLIKNKCGDDTAGYMEDAKKKQKLMGYLLRRGYSYSEIREAIRISLDDRSSVL